MNPMSFETFGLFLALAYIFMCAYFIIHQKQGKNFVDSFDKSFMLGAGIFIVGYSLDAVAYVANG